MISSLFVLPRLYRTSIVVVADAIFCVLAVWVAMILRTESLEISTRQLLVPSAISVSCLVPLMVWFGVYKEITRFSGSSTFFSILKAFFVYIPVFAFIVTFVSLSSVPRSVGLLQPIILIGLVLNTRLVVRGLNRPSATSAKNKQRKVIIYGAGQAGRQLANAIKQVHGVRVFALFDDDIELINKRINGIRVLDPTQLEKTLAEHDIDVILLSTNTMDFKRKTFLVEAAVRNGVPVQILPGIQTLLDDPINLERLKDIEIDDLLGREPMKPDPSKLQENVSNKVVLISGAGGSIGSELVLQLARLGPKKLVLLESSEFALYTLVSKTSKISGIDSVEIEPVLGSVCDREAMFALLASIRPDTVFHAAAYKHVHIVEHNPFVGLQTNYFGTQNLADAAVVNGVEVFLLISSDKAVRPTNIMGASKRLAELYIQSLSKQKTTTKFVSVRFGNVLGTSGSVVPAFKAQLQSNGPLTVTHPDMERYFMTISEAVELVIQTSVIGGSGDILLLDMGSPVKIDTLARQMVALAGLTLRDESHPDGQIEIVYVGLRPGEKLYEELLVDGASMPTSHPRIFKADETNTGLLVFCKGHETLKELDSASDIKSIKAAVKTLVPEYEPFADVN